MSFNFAAQSLAGAPTVLSPPSKDIQVKAIKLVAADFTTGGAASVKAVLPADASIIGIRTWVKTQLAGGSVSAATLSIGVPGAATQFVNAASQAFGVVGAYTQLGVMGSIFQDYNIPLGADIQLLFTGTATTGNPTSGELYVLVEYVR